MEAIRAPSEILVWCDDPSEMDVTVDAMIAEGRIKPGQRIVCVHWSRATAGPGAQEEALAELETAS